MTLKDELQHFSGDEVATALQTTIDKLRSDQNYVAEEMLNRLYSDYPGVAGGYAYFHRAVELDTESGDGRAFMLGVRTALMALVELSETQEVWNQFPDVDR